VRQGLLMKNTLELVPSEHEMNEVLEQIVSNDKLHAQWLNVLSYLEFVGSRKIFKTQGRELLNESVLRHASDEARHALILKQLIEKLDLAGYDEYSNENMLCSFSAYRYFQSLDSIIKKNLLKENLTQLNRNSLCYLYVSHIIEIRANWLYRIYSSVLAKLNSKISIQTIINDEKKHLMETEELLLKLDKDLQNRVNHFLSGENIIFNRFFKSLRSHLIQE